MHEREGPKKINTCPRIEEELWTFQVPTILALKMDLLIFFLTNFIFENRLKTYAKGGKYVQMLKYKGEFSLRENSMEGGFPIGIWRGHYEALCIENTLFFVLQTSTSSLGTAVLHLSYENDLTDFSFFFFDLYYLKNNRLKSSNVWYTHYECFTYFVIWLFNSLVCRVITHSIMKGLNQKA